MKYEVSEKKFYKIENISKVLDIEYELKHLETTFDLEKYDLEINLKYEDINVEEQSLNVVMPIELATSMTEQLFATINNLEVKLVNNDGIELDITLDIEVIEIDIDKEEIHEIYQAELEAKLQEREEIVVEEIVEQNETIEPIMTINTAQDNNSDNLFSNLKTEYVKYKVISLDENSLDKISVKYNLALDYLYNLKKINDKVIVYDKE